MARNYVKMFTRVAKRQRSAAHQLHFNGVADLVVFFELATERSGQRAWWVRGVFVDPSTRTSRLGSWRWIIVLTYSLRASAWKA